MPLLFGFSIIFLGVWASGSCPHTVVYCLKFVLRGESPRDYVNLLRSLKFPPSVSICDIPDRLARYMYVNNTLPGFFPLYHGMLFPSTEENLLNAEQGLFVKSLSWLHDDGASTLANSATKAKQEAYIQLLESRIDTVSLTAFTKEIPARDLLFYIA